jgi:hypothetical protein
MKQVRLVPVVYLILLFALIFVACGAPAPATTSAPPTNTAAIQLAATPVPVLADLHGPNQLKAVFNQDAGMPRIILLASPT